MKVVLFLITFGFLINANAKGRAQYPFPLDPQAPSQSYEGVLANVNMPLLLAQDPQETAQLKAIVEIGKRNLAWLKFINAHRSTPLTFTTPRSLGGIPIDAPVKYSGKIEIEKYNAYVAGLPAEMKAILVDGKDFSENPPIAEEDYTKLGHKMDVIYQYAVRWLGMQNWLDWYEQNRFSDIRGYYFLAKEANLETELGAWDTLPADQQTKLRPWLLGECLNSVQSDSECASRLDEAIADHAVWDFQQEFAGDAKQKYDEFFDISNPRPDFTWTNGNPNVGSLLFRDPQIEKIRNFLSVNIEDEWKWNGWQLKLDFQPQADVHVEFESGVTPHVNGIGGNTITMDENTPLTEWDIQWTIRHEFGHVMGFPDCYVEFYDPSEQAMVSYQIDISNLMCSRAGKFKQEHFDQLKKAYFN